MTEVPEGWKLVPVEPTQEMWDAAWEASGDYFVGDAITKKGFQKGLAAMLASTPDNPPVAEKPDFTDPDACRVYIDKLEEVLDTPKAPNPASDRGEVDYARVSISDLCNEIGKLDADFPNYGDWPVHLPAGHWRAIAAALSASPASGEVERLLEALQNALYRLGHANTCAIGSGRRCSCGAAQVIEEARQALSASTSPKDTSDGIA